jgi:hypothetical protein
MQKLTSNPVSGAYIASHSHWSNGFPVYTQTCLPIQQSEHYVIEFHMRLEATAANSSDGILQRRLGVWELKSADRAGAAHCLFNFNTQCDSAILTIPPVTSKGSPTLQCHPLFLLDLIPATYITLLLHRFLIQQLRWPR